MVEPVDVANSVRLEFLKDGRHLGDDTAPGTVSTCRRTSRVTWADRRGCDMSDEVTVAIACQGGGSHTAFTAGVLGELLPPIDDRTDRLVGLSGASTGSFAAVAGWYGRLADDTTAPAVSFDL